MLDLIANLTILSVVTASGIWRGAMVDADRFYDQRRPTVHYYGGPLLSNGEGDTPWISFTRPDQIKIAADVCQSFAPADIQHLAFASLNPHLALSK